jgi:hypothetical protein
MLRTEAPFPNVGAKALLIETHRAIPVRILQNGEGRGKSRQVLIALLDRDGSSGNRRVPLADLEDATPLTEAEQHEYIALEIELAGKARPLKAKAARLERLRLRAVHHAELERAESAARRNLHFARRLGRA